MFILKNCFLASALLFSGVAEAALGKPAARKLQTPEGAAAFYEQCDPNDPERIPGTADCCACKTGCSKENTDVIETIFGAGTTFDDSGDCKGACSDTYSSHYCMCSDELCSKYDYDRIPGTHECGACKTACSRLDKERLDYIFETSTSYTDSGECKGDCSTLFGTHHCMCGPTLCSKHDEGRIPGTYECGACKEACSGEDQERLDYIFGVPTNFGDSGECKGACSDKYGSHYCMCGDGLCSEYDEGRIEGTHECGACKTACGLNNEEDQARLDYIFGEVNVTFTEGTSCKGMCSVKYGDDKCMCGNNLCSDVDTDQPHSHDNSEDDEERIPGTEVCGKCKSACHYEDQAQLDMIFVEEGESSTFADSGECKGACSDKYGSHYCMCGGDLCSKYDDDRIPGTEECGACKTACSKDDTERLDYIFGVPTAFTDSGECKGACSDKYGSHFCMCGNGLCSEYDEDRIPGTHECGACKTACSKEDTERVDYIFGVPTAFETSGDCKGACVDKFGSHYCMCGPTLCSKGDEGRIEGTYECGACKTACGLNHDGDQERLDYIFETEDITFPEGTSCKGMCSEKYGDDMCMCGNNLCSEVDTDQPHSHDNSEDDEERIPGTEVCGTCKSACHYEDQAQLDIIFVGEGESSTFDDMGQCKGACSVKYGSHYCMCGGDLCSKYDEDRIPGTEECGACKSACSREDTERVDYIFGVPTNFTDAGQCKGSCVDKFGTHYCMCGPDLCSKNEEGRIEGTHECGACKSACSRNDIDRINYIFGEETDFASSGPCKGACQDLFGDANCMCGNSLCTEFEDGESHSHDGDMSSDSHDGSDETFQELACSNPDFSILCTLVESCPETVDGPVTVFAPTDEAFMALDSAVGGLSTVDDDILCGILSFHIVSGAALTSSDLTAQYCETGDGSLLEMANGVDSRIKCLGGVPYGIKGGGNDDIANFVTVDIMASNGVVHVIDNVLFYPRVFDGGSNVVPTDVVPSLRGALP